jgi:AraC-like DNA-binding protein/tetratricopeptide (TPR) repeat protein
MDAIERIRDIEPGRRRPLPPLVKRALDHMHANLGETVTLSSLTATCSASERTLLRQFERHVGLSPLACLRRLRLNAARRELLEEGSSRSIADIATRCGFSHLGRFATEYRRLFDETPSSTKQRVTVRVGASSSSANATASPPSIIGDRRPSLLILPLRTAALHEGLEARDLTERLAAALSRMGIASVVLAHPSHTASVIAPQPRTLLADYCLAGRLMRFDERTRVIVRLVDVAADRHIWGDSFDGSADDPFELQDRIVDGVLCAAVSHITDAEIDRATRKDPNDLAARELALRMLPLVLTGGGPGAERAIAMLAPALARYPADAVLTALLACCHLQLAGYDATVSVAAGRKVALRLSQTAALLDDGDPMVTIARATVAGGLLQSDEDEALTTRALAMDPTSAWAWERRGYLRARRAEDADIAISDFQRSMRFRGPAIPRANCLHGIAAAHHAAGRFEQAILLIRTALAETPDAVWMHKLLSCAANKLGDKATIAASVDCIRRARPHATVSQFVEVWPYADADWLEAIARAGMPL